MEYFKKHISEVFNLNTEQVERLIDEFDSFYKETIEQYVVRRHAELKREGLKNEWIYSRLIEEVAQRRFASEMLTERQIRRMIYG